MTDNDFKGWTVTREVPIPTSISGPARQALVAGGEMLRVAAANTPPAAEDHDAWRRHIEFADSMMLAMFGERAASVDAQIDDRDIDGVPVYVIVPAGLDDPATAPVYLDIHGGALVMGGGACCRAMSTTMAGGTGMLTWAVDYRTPPDHPYPAALDDCLTVYRALLDQRSPDQIVVGGASAGGNLAAALMLRLAALGLPMPAACVLLSPQLDLTESGDSFAANLGLDTALPRSLAAASALYAAGADLTSPELSPLFGDVSSFPRTFLQSGTRDLFLSNAVRMHRKLRSAGVDADLHVFEAMPHGGFGGAPEDRELMAELRRFLGAALATSAAGRPS